MTRYRYMDELELEISGYSFHSTQVYLYYSIDNWFHPNVLLPRIIPVGCYGKELTKDNHILQNGYYFECILIKENPCRKHY